MDDEVVGTWHLDPSTRIALRLDKVRRALDVADWSLAMLEAEELLDEQPHHGEALFLLAEAMLELGESENAADAYEHHLEVTGRDDGLVDDRKAAALAGLTIARFESCDMPGAVEAAREALRITPDRGETHYYLGLALERLPGRKQESISAFMAAHQLDPKGYPLPLHLGDAAWQQALDRALQATHPRVRAFWAGVPLRFEDLPALDELRRHRPPITPTVSGLYEGELPESDPWATRPPAMRFFRGNLARLPTVESIVEEMARTLQAEALDWLGLTAEELEAEEQ